MRNEEMMVYTHIYYIDVCVCTKFVFVKEGIIWFEVGVSLQTFIHPLQERQFRKTYIYVRL